jgi:hypothetical protein
VAARGGTRPLGRVAGRGVASGDGGRGIARRPRRAARWEPATGGGLQLVVAQAAASVTRGSASGGCGVAGGLGATPCGSSGGGDSCFFTGRGG